jgi:hypothetical protein
MTPTQTLCQAARLTVEAAAKKARLCPRYMASIVNRGTNSCETAARLARILECDMMIFLWGYKTWVKNSHNRSIAPSESVNPASRGISQTERRRHILKLSPGGKEPAK